MEKPTLQWLNQPNNRRMMLKRDEMAAAMHNTEVRPCISRQATPEECEQYSIKGQCTSAPGEGVKAWKSGKI